MTDNPSMSPLPTVSLIVLNYNGQRHLAGCLPSLLKLDYPADRLELILVDNASSDDSVAYTETHFPQVRIIRSPVNGGFAAGNNLGARQATGQYLIFLNNDMWVDPQFVRALVTAAASDPAIAAVGAKILNWDGSETDFAGAGMQYAGFGYQLGYEEPVDPNRYNRLEPLLFACGGAMLIDRQVYLELGGFDDDYFLFFEDVDLGWRLWLSGYGVVIAPEALVYHRHHGSTGRLPDYRVQMLYTRNALYSVIKNYSDENLAAVLPAILLSAVSGVVSSASRRRLFDPEQFTLNSRQPAPSSVRIDRHSASTLAALQEVAAELPRLMTKRHLVQQRRRVSDAEYMHLLGRPLRFFPNVALDVHLTVADAMGVSKIFAETPRRVLVISSDILPYPGLPTVGSGLRAWGIGQGLISRGHEVLFSMPLAALSGREGSVPAAVRDLAWEAHTLEAIVKTADPDVVVVCNWPVLGLLPTDKLGIPVILDQHGPHMLERLFQGFSTPQANTAAKLAALRKADFFTCAGHRQLQYFQSWLKRAGWTETERQTNTAAIPVSLSPALPERQPDPELSFVYGGVFLPWQDPSMGLTTLVEALEQHRRGRLYFFGGEHPVYPVTTGVFKPLLEQLKRSPFVTAPGMVSHDALIDRYTRAHVAVDVMQRNEERELAFTTRTVEYLWCGLPVIYHDYAELSDYIREYEAGWVVNPDDPAAMRTVLETVFTQPDEVARRSRNAQRLVRERLAWDVTIAPLDHCIRHPRVRPHPPEPLSPEQRVEQVRRLFSIAWIVFRRDGPVLLLRDLWVFLKRQLRPADTQLPDKETAHL